MQRAVPPLNLASASVKIPPLPQHLLPGLSIQVKQGNEPDFADPFPWLLGLQKGKGEHLSQQKAQYLIFIFPSKLVCVCSNGTAAAAPLFATCVCARRGAGAGPAAPGAT